MELVRMKALPTNVNSTGNFKESKRTKRPKNKPKNTRKKPYRGQGKV